MSMGQALVTGREPRIDNSDEIIRENQMMLWFLLDRNRVGIDPALLRGQTCHRGNKYNGCERSSCK